MLKIGCIADDFTGASDIASFFQKGGLRTALLSGVPVEKIGDEFDAIVIALKTRTDVTSVAVSDSIAAASWLKDMGAEHFYVKYCSTFDSTPDGNIGPIIDAVMDFLDVDTTIICPALPVNGRVVTGGRLFVLGLPLDESPMKNHPLTPMWDSYIAKLMQPQAKHHCLVLDDVSGYSAEISAKIDEFRGENPRFYIVPEHKDDCDAERIVELFGDMKLLTGGSGIAEALGRRYVNAVENQTGTPTKIAGKSIILAGSCSTATVAQVEKYIADGGKAVQMLPERILDGSQTVDGIWSEVLDCDCPVLIYSSQRADEVRKAQNFGRERISAALESATARLAKLADTAGFAHIIVAGGETSGAVTKELGYSGFEIGNSVAAGVPIMIPTANQNLRLVLKSGNFGDEDFFAKTLKMVGEDLA